MDPFQEMKQQSNSAFNEVKAESNAAYSSIANKMSRLNGNASNPADATLSFPMDLLSPGQDNACMTFFINTIRNGKAKMRFNGGIQNPKNRLKSAYGEMPVIHNVSRSLQGSNVKSFSNTFVRSPYSITLPMPKNLNINVQARWATTDLGAAAMGLDQAVDYSKLMENGAGGELAKQIGLNTVGSIASKFAGGAIKGRELVELGTATVVNNYAETLFKQVENRSFSWTWTITPRNEKEVQIIDSMLRLFRFHMLPEFKENVGNGNAFLLYPSSFDIMFWQDGQPNPYLPRVSTCALVGMDTNYTPNGSYIKMVNGAPASYILTLNFVELSILHKGMVGEDPTNSGTTF